MTQTPPPRWPGGACTYRQDAVDLNAVQAMKPAT